MNITNEFHKNCLSMIQRNPENCEMEGRHFSNPTCTFTLHNYWVLTLSLLGYLKTRICWGGVNLTPPSKSHVWCPNMTNATSLESSCALLLKSAKKFANMQKLNFLSQNPVIQKKNLSKKWKIIHFWKALDHANSNMQKCLQNFK